MLNFKHSKNGKFEVVIVPSRGKIEYTLESQSNPNLQGLRSSDSEKKGVQYYSIFTTTYIGKLPRLLQEFADC